MIRCLASLLPNTAEVSDCKRDIAENLNADLVTTDDDLWPISSSAYNLPDGVKVLSLNSYCCGKFKHGTQMYEMVSLANISACLATWQRLIYGRFCHFRVT